MKTHSKVTKWSLIVGIVIILNMFINYSVSLVFDAPKYDEFCDDLRKPVAVEITDEILEEQDRCWEEYDEAREDFEKNVFVVLISIGIILFISSLFISNYVLSVSLSIGAILDLVIASMRYWGDAHELLKVVILGLALAVLIGIGIKKFGDK